MKAKVLTSKTKELSLSITETDIGILYIIQHELLKAPGISFAGVIVKHPLTNECWMRVNSASKPLAEVKKAADSATQMAEKFKALFHSEIKAG